MSSLSNNSNITFTGSPNILDPKYLLSLLISEGISKMGISSHSKLILIRSIPAVIFLVINPILLLIVIPNLSGSSLASPLLAIIWYSILFSFSLAPLVLPRWIANLTINRNHRISWLWTRTHQFNRGIVRAWIFMMTGLGLYFLYFTQIRPNNPYFFNYLLFYILYLIGVLITSGKEPLVRNNSQPAEPNDADMGKNKGDQEFSEEEDESKLTNDDALEYLHSLISMFYDDYELAIRQTELNYIRWWIGSPMRFEVTNGYLSQTKDNLRLVTLNELGRIPYFNNKLKTPIAIITGLSMIVGFILTPFFFPLFNSPWFLRIILFSPLNSVLQLLRYLLIVIIPLNLFKVPFYYMRYQADLYLYDKLGEESWKDYRSSIINIIDHSTPWFARFTLLNPTQVMIVQNTIKRRDIELD